MAGLVSAPVIEPHRKPGIHRLLRAARHHVGEALAHRLSESVPLATIYCDDKRFYVEAGWGGKHLSHCPITKSFALYHAGHIVEGFEAFEEWYHDMFRNYLNQPAAEGGLRGSSLVKKIGRVHASTGETFNPEAGIWNADLVRQAIKLRVQERFQTFESIRRYGYKERWGNVIKVDPYNGGFILRDGHHRASAVLALGGQSLEGVLVRGAHLLLRPFERRRSSAS